MVLLGYSPPARAGGTEDELPVRVTEEVARLSDCALAIVAFDDEGHQPPRLLIPITEDFHPGITEDLARIAALFGGASVALLGLLPAGLDDAEAEARAEALRSRAETLHLKHMHKVDLRGREACDCLFGAEIGQMGAAGLQPVFLLRAQL